jgi:parallel beta-helix repeat protein
MKKAVSLPIFAAAILLMIIPLSPLPIANAAKITVPNDFPNIQEAIDAASDGDTIKILSGTYTEQLVINKDLKIEGAGAKSTIISAPAALDTNILGLTYIVEVNSGAKVSMNGITINGVTSCDVFFGITVLEGATLNLDSDTITGCNQVGVLVGTTRTPTPQTGHATITKTNINSYQDTGIVARAEGTTLSVSQSKVNADKNSPSEFGTAGITVGSGAKGNIHHNEISGNICNNSSCGPDFVNQLQSYAIVTFDAGAGTIISHNKISNNDGGIFLIGSSGCCKVERNKLTDNQFFGIVIQDGEHTISYTKISGGNVGVLAAAIFADTIATLDHVKIEDATTPIQELECCGFTAEVVTIPPNSFQSSQFKSTQAPEVDPDFLTKKFGFEEDTSVSSSPVSPF